MIVALNIDLAKLVIVRFYKDIPAIRTGGN
jgi:hypothetical protein